MTKELKELTVGEILGKSMNLFFSEFLKIFKVMGLSVIAITLLCIPIFYALDYDSTSGLLFLFILPIILFFPGFLSARITYIAAEKISGQKFSGFKSSSKKALLIFVFLLLLIVVNYIPILGIVLGIGWTLFIPALCIEDTGISKSLSRSWALTKDSKWKIFGLKILFGAILMAIFGALAVVMVLLMQQGEGSDIFNNTGALAILGFIYILMALVFFPLNAIFDTVIYYDFRVRKEGYDIEHLTQQIDEVFD